MNRVWWWDRRPKHVKPVVGWWAWHFPRLTLYRPRQCPECRTRGAHKMNCHRSHPTPWYVVLALTAGLVGASFAFGYSLAMTGLPDVVGVWGWFAISSVIAVGYCNFAIRTFQDWWRTR